MTPPKHSNGEEAFLFSYGLVCRRRLILSLSPWYLENYLFDLVLDILSVLPPPPHSFLVSLIFRKLFIRLGARNTECVAAAAFIICRPDI